MPPGSKKNDMMTKKKSVIITGAAGGIGRATALKFAAAGFNLSLVDNNKEGLDKLGLEIKANHQTEPLLVDGDLATMKFLELVVANAAAAWGKIDVLVNNAAWRTVETMRTISMETWEKTMRVCLTAPAFLAKKCAAHMEENGVAGVIINMSSIMASRAPGYSPAYVTAKGGLESLTRELAVTYGRSGIRVLSVSPGFIDTELSSDYVDKQGNDSSQEIARQVIGSTPLSRSGSPEEVASAICWLASEQASFINGTNLLVDGGLKHNFNDYSIKNIQFPEEY